MYRFSLPLNAFAGSPFNREVLRRADPEWVSAMLDGPRARFVLVDCPEILTRPPDGSTWWSVNFIPERQRRNAILLGSDRRWTYFAVDVAGAEEMKASALREADRIHLKRDALELPSAAAALLAFARAMVYWHGRHRYCGACGAPTVAESAGHIRRCSGEGCDSIEFPRTDVAVIALVTDADRCLLVRQPEWPTGHFATVAGFLEPGESLEDAMAREVGEEAGLRVESLDYHSSQPWPFPGSIMVGYHARVADTRTDLSGPELDDVRWFTREQLAQSTDSGAITLPPRVSISYRLIQDWYGSAADGELSAGPPQAW